MTHKIQNVVSEKRKSSNVEEIGRSRMMKQTGISSEHDLRVFELNLDCSSAIFQRQGAIVFNLDEIKVIITAKEILIPDHENPWLLCFTHHLETNFCGTRNVANKAAEESLYNALPVPEAIGGREKTYNSDVTSSKPLLPFEFRALEICLQSVCEIL